MDWTEALARLAAPAGWSDEALHEAELAVAAAVAPHCTTAAADLEQWIADAAGTWTGSETPQSIAAEYDA